MQKVPKIKLLNQIFKKYQKLKYVITKQYKKYKEHKQKKHEYQIVQKDKKKYFFHILIGNRFSWNLAQRVKKFTIF